MKQKRNHHAVRPPSSPSRSLTLPPSPSQLPVPKPQHNRSSKDFLFRYILADKKVLLELYNALNGTDYENTTALQINTLQDAVYIGYKNDLSFLLGHTINLYEHQSTINPNMPLRGLFYITTLYESHIALSGGNLYHNKLIRLPSPQYIVFYNGTDRLPERQIVRLSDAYINPDNNSGTKTNISTKINSGTKINGGTRTNISTNSGEALANNKFAAGPCLEMTATVLNINYGNNKELLGKCRELEEYSIFVEQVRRHLSRGLEMKQALEEAIELCIRENILKDILLKNQAEVKNMLLTHFDYDEYIAYQRADAAEDAREEAREEARRDSIEKLIEVAREEYISETRIMEILQTKYNLSADETKKYLN